MVQWLGLCAFTVKGPDSNLGQESKISKAAWCSHKKKRERQQTKQHTHTHTHKTSPPSPKKCILVFNAMETKLTLHPATTVSKHIHIPYSQEKKHFAPPGKNELTCLVLLKNT